MKGDDKMSILSGFRKQKRYATDEKGHHQLISTWTHTDTVYDDEGKSLTEIIEDLPAADKKVQQTATDSTNANYEILFSESADNVTKSEEARKSSGLLYNPGTKKLSLAGSKLEVTGSNNGTTEVGGGSMTISRNNNLMEPQLSIYNEHSGGEALLRSNNIQIRDDYTSPTKVMEIQQEDIVITGDTWDGTNTSLKTALANAGAKVLYGTSAPTSVQGEDGQLYVRLRALDPYLEDFTVDYGSGSSGIIDTGLITDNLSDCNVYIKQYQEVAGVETLIYEYDDTIDLGNITSIYIRDENNDPLCTLYSMGGAGMPRTLQIQKDNDNDKLVMTVVDATATADAIDTIYIKDNGSWLIDDGDIPSPTASDVGKILKATDVGEYDWGAAPDPLPSITSSDNGKVLTARNSNWVKETLPKDAYFINIVFYGGEPTLPTGLGITLADISPSKPVYLLNNTVGSDDNGKVYAPVFIDSTITLGVKENAEWQCISTEIVNGKEVTYVERIVYYMNADDQSEETVTYTKEELSSGGSEAVYKTLAEYEALPTADKEDPTKIYFVINEGTKVSPTLDANDGNCNATNAPAYAWWCLSGNASTEFQISDGGLSEYNSPAWWSYHFSTRQIFSKVKMRYRNNSSENRVRFSIQASNDGSTWNEILNGSPKYVNLTTENTDMEFVVDTGNVAYEYIRLRFDMPSGWAAGAIKICGNLEIYATANSSSPMVYYKNLLYTPSELPITSTSDTGKALVVNSDGVWDKGTIPPSVTPVEIEAEDYHALTTVEKEDPTKIYFVKAGRVITDPVSVIPRNPSSSNIDCNTGSASYNTSAAYAFDGVMNSPPDIRATEAYGVSAWYPGYGNAPASAWASYHFDSVTTNLVKLEVYAYNMSTSAPETTWTTPVIVEGSTDGTTWFNVLEDGDSSFTLSSKETEFVKNVIPIDNTVSVSYIRLRFLNQINDYNGINFAIAEIYAYTGNVVVYDDSTYYKGIKHGKTLQELPDLAAADEGKVLKAVNGKWAKDVIYVECTQNEYDALPSSKNSDGIIYFING